MVPPDEQRSVERSPWKVKNVLWDAEEGFLNLSDVDQRYRFAGSNWKVAYLNYERLHVEL